MKVDIIINRVFLQKGFNSVLERAHIAKRKRPPIKLTKVLGYKGDVCIVDGLLSDEQVKRLNNIYKTDTFTTPLGNDTVRFLILE